MKAATKVVWILGVGFLPVCFQGCATIIHGTRQSLSIQADTTANIVVDGIAYPAQAGTAKLSKGAPVNIQVDGSFAGRDAAYVNLTRKENHLIELESSGRIIRFLPLRRRTSAWIWGNAMMSIWGLGGVWYDYHKGGAYYLEPDAYAISPDLRLPHVDVDPWTTGSSHGSLALNVDVKVFGNDFEGSRVGVGSSIQWVWGKNDWPLDIVMTYDVMTNTRKDTLHLPGVFGQVYHYNRQYTFRHFDAGVRKTFFLDKKRIHPYVSGGVSLMFNSGGAQGGPPTGLWARSGVDFRLGGHFLVSPSFGFSKHETTSSDLNTGGPLAGLMFGFLW